MWGRAVWAPRGLFDVPAGLWDVHHDDHLDDNHHDETSQLLHHDHHPVVRSRFPAPDLSAQFRRLSGRTDVPDGPDWLLVRGTGSGL